VVDSRKGSRRTEYKCGARLNASSDDSAIFGWCRQSHATVCSTLASDTKEMESEGLESACRMLM
jgi:hypothetical protein